MDDISGVCVYIPDLRSARAVVSRFPKNVRARPGYRYQQQYRVVFLCL
jgi:hypothetical protein